MNANRSNWYPLFLALALHLVLLPACGPVPTATVPQATQPSVQPTQPAAKSTGDISLDYSALAGNVTVETVAAKPASLDSPNWDALPQYRQLTLQGYPVTNHLFKPQIFVYPAGELATYNEGAGQIAADLGALLQSRQAGDHLPFLPLHNAAQVMHTQVQYMEFKNGQGIRYLTQLDQAPLPINNYELIYTFQGLTSDGQYYVAAVMPVTNPGLPADDRVDEQLLNTFRAYLSTTVAMLDQQPAESFTPDLNTLDALVRSIDVK